MKVLKKLNKMGLGAEPHEHVVYLSSDSGVGLCSFDAGHSHQIEFQPEVPPTPPSVDPMTGQEIPGDPGRPEQWFVLPHLDGHTHEIVEPVLKTKKRKPDDDDLIQEVHELLRVGLDGEKESIEDGRLAYKFYHGEQWDEQDKQVLFSNDRAALTFNCIGKEVDQLDGYQRQNRQDLHFLPQEGGDQITADILNHVSKQILESTFFQREKGKVSKDQAVPGRGVFNIYVDFTRDLRGQVKIERFPWDDIVFGPHEKEDLEDCEFLIKHRMYSKAKIKQMWPDKADDIEDGFDNFLINTSAATSHHSYATDQYAKSDNVYPVAVGDMQLVDVGRKEIRVLECWRKRFEKAYVATEPNEDFYLNLYGWSKKDIDRIRTLPGFVVVERNVSKIAITKIAGNTVLSHEDPADLPVDDFFVVPVYAYKDHQKFYGKVKNAMDPQREINKRRSQSIDIGNKMVAYGWFVDANTFPDGEEEKFRANSTKPGFVVKVNNVNNPPKQVEGVKFPSELAQMIAAGREEVSYLMNVIPEPGGANESGSALMQKQNLKLTGNEFLFDAMSFAQKKIGELLVAIIQRYYSPERIYRMLNNKHTESPIELGGQSFDQYSEEEIVDLLSNADLLMYDVSISESSYSPSAQAATFVMLTELAGKGVPVPPEAIIETSRIPDSTKKKILSSMEQQAASQAEAAQAAQNAEIQKTLIAQGIIPPDIQEAMGIQDQVGQQVQQQPTQTDGIMNLAG